MGNGRIYSLLLLLTIALAGCHSVKAPPVLPTPTIESAETAVSNVPQPTVTYENPQFSCLATPFPTILWFAEPQNQEDTPAIFSGQRIGGSSGALKIIYLYLFSADSHILRIYDISNPRQPALLSSLVLPDFVDRFIYRDNFLYAHHRAAYDGISIINVANPAEPSLEGCLPLTSRSYDFALGTHAYIAAIENGIEIVDVQNPTTLVSAGAYIPPRSTETVNRKAFDIWHVAALENIVYFVARSNEGNNPVSLQLLDSRNPNNPRLLDFQYQLTSSFSPTHELMQCGPLLFAAQANETFLFDISTPDQPNFINRFTVGRLRGFVDGKIIFLAEDDTPVYLPLSEIELTTNIKGAVEHLSCTISPFWEVFENVTYTADCCGVRLWDNSTETAEFITQLPNRKLQVSWLWGGSFSIANNHAYFVVVDQDLQILPLADPIATITSVPKTALAVQSPIDVAATDNFLFILDEDQTLSTATLKNPTTPVLLSETTLVANLLRIAAQGNFLYGLAEEGVYIFDTSNPENIREVGSYPLTINPSRRGDIQVGDEYLYVTSGNGSDETNQSFLVLRVSHSTKPELITTDGRPFSHMAEANGFLIFLSVASKILGILDLRDLSQPVQIATGLAPEDSWIADMDSDEENIYLLLGNGSVAKIDPTSLADHILFPR